MDELKGKILAGENSFEKLMNKIPGYAGYHERERRREADKIQRTFLADKVKLAKNKLLDFVDLLSRTPNIEYITELDRVEKIFDKVADRIRYADYGYAGFFDAVKINEAELDKIYDFDLSLINLISAVEESLIALEPSIESGEGLKEKARATEKAIRELDSRFDEREKMITGVV